MKTQTRAVVIGGGIAGCSTLYHLTQEGWTDVVLVERDELTSGTTWHAAGLVSLSWATPTLTELAKYSRKLYASLEEETGQATGYKRIGSISLARTEARLEEIKRTSSVCKVFVALGEVVMRELRQVEQSSWLQSCLTLAWTSAFAMISSAVV